MTHFYCCKSYQYSIYRIDKTKKKYFNNSLNLTNLIHLMANKRFYLPRKRNNTGRKMSEHRVIKIKEDKKG